VKDPTGLPPLTYLTFDSVSSGVGASQVLPYVERMSARGLEVRLHSFEPGPPETRAERRLEVVGASWTKHAFGKGGPAGGAWRVARAAAAIGRADLVHARSDIGAAAALLSRCHRWVWDVRSFWADQRIELGALRAGSPTERVLRSVERRSAESAHGIVTLTEAAMDSLQTRYGEGLTECRAVVPTCVDLAAFAFSTLPKGPVRLLLSGSLNRYYDVPTIIRFASLARRRFDATLTVLTPGPTPWDEQLSALQPMRSSSPPEGVADHVAASTVGLSICRTNVGRSLKAAMPTKLGEFLACGRPVIINAGLGNMESLLERYACGVVVRGSSDAALNEAINHLERLLSDPGLAQRCRNLAEDHFDLDAGVERLINLYERVLQRRQ
jgi:glycosyltransferase involved in cell wall biosynthesis